MTLSKEHLGRLKNDENNFLNCIVTGDEVLIHYTKPKTKAQSKQWNRAGFPPPKKFKLSRSSGKVMRVAFWDSRGIKLAHYLPKGGTVSVKFCSEVFFGGKEPLICMAMPSLILPDLH